MKLKDIVREQEQLSMLRAWYISAEKYRRYKQKVLWKICFLHRTVSPICSRKKYPNYTTLNRGQILFSLISIWEKWTPIKLMIKDILRGFSQTLKNFDIFCKALRNLPGYVQLISYFLVRYCSNSLFEMILIPPTKDILRK